MSCIRSLRRTLAAAAALAALAAPASAQPITIDFEGLGTDVEVTDQFPGAVFSATKGYVNVTVVSAASASRPHVIGTKVDGGFLTMGAETFVDFPIPVNGLRFTACEIDDPSGIVGTCTVHRVGAPPQTLSIHADGEPQQVIDLSQIDLVTRLELHGNGDLFGMGWDDFVFTPMHALDFDTLDAFAVVDAQFPQATFSTAPGMQVYAVPLSLPGFSAPRALKAAASPDGPAFGPLTIDFACPVKFPTLGVAFTGGLDPLQVHVLRFRAFAGPALVDEQIVFGGVADALKPVHLTAPQPDVDRIVVDSPTASGLLYDDVWFASDHDAAVVEYGEGWPGTDGVPRLELSKPPQLGTQPVLWLGNSSQTPKTLFVFLGLQRSELATPFGGTLLTSGELVLPIPLGAWDGGLVFTVPPVCGATVRMQTLQPDPGAAGGIAFSRGLEVSIGF